MSGLFEHKYPTTNLHELDLSWILQKITEFGQRLDSFETDLHDKLLAETEAYVDQEMAGLRADFADLVESYTALQLMLIHSLQQLDLILLHLQVQLILCLIL